LDIYHSIRYKLTIFNHWTTRGWK